MYAGANTRISCYASSDRTACAAFFAESRMKLGNATSLDRKSGTWGTRPEAGCLSRTGSLLR
jgi:hypothetical protein